MTSLDVYLVLLIMLFVAVAMLTGLFITLSGHVDKIERRMHTMQKKTTTTNSLYHVHTRPFDGR